MTNQFEMVNGVLQAMSDEDQASYDALQAAWPATQAANLSQEGLPDLTTQVANLTAALLFANVIPDTALPSAQITAVNNKLTEIGAATISTQLSAQPVLKVALP